MINGISLQVEILAGEDIDSASTNLCRLSDKLEMMVKANFNGVLVCVSPGSLPIEISDEIHREMNRGE